MRSPARLFLSPRRRTLPETLGKWNDMWLRLTPASRIAPLAATGARLGSPRPSTASWQQWHPTTKDGGYLASEDFSSVSAGYLGAGGCTSHRPSRARYDPRHTHRRRRRKPVSHRSEIQHDLDDPGSSQRHHQSRLHRGGTGPANSTVSADTHIHSRLLAPVNSLSLIHSQRTFP